MSRHAIPQKSKKENTTTKRFNGKKNSANFQVEDVNMEIIEDYIQNVISQEKSEKSLEVGNRHREHSNAQTIESEESDEDGLGFTEEERIAFKIIDEDKKSDRNQVFEENKCDGRENMSISNAEMNDEMK